MTVFQYVISKAVCVLHTVKTVYKDYHRDETKSGPNIDMVFIYRFHIMEIIPQRT